MKFYSRKQRPNKSVTGYAAVLKLLAAEGEFRNFLNDALRDIFCIGIADVETQKKLRADKTPNLVEAVKLPLARETLSRQMQGLAASPANGGHKVNQPRPHSTILSAHQTQQTCGRLHFCSKGVSTTQAKIVCPRSLRQPQVLENVISVAERTTIQGTADSRVMSAEIVEKRDTYKPCAEAEGAA